MGAQDNLARGHIYGLRRNVVLAHAENHNLMFGELKFRRAGSSIDGAVAVAVHANPAVVGIHRPRLCVEIVGNYNVVADRSQPTLFGRNEAFEFFEPVLNEKQLVHRSKIRFLPLHHQKPLTVKGQVP